MTSIGPSSLAYSFGKSREHLVLFVTIWGFQHSSRKTKHLCALMEPKQGFECGSWASTGRLVGELKAHGKEEGEDKLDKRLSIGDQLEVGGWVLEIDGDGAVVACRFGGLC